MSAYERMAAAVLTFHQRHDASSCLCGWSELGHSHAEHVASVLADAGALNVAPAGRRTAVEAAIEHELAGVRHEASALREWVDAVLADEKQAVRERDEAKATADLYREGLEAIAYGRIPDTGWAPHSLLTAVEVPAAYARRVLEGLS